MKYKIVLLILFPILFTGCNDFLELVPPDGLVKDEYWQYKEDVEATLMGAYQQFANLDATLFLLGELRADFIVEDNNTVTDHRNIMIGNIFPNNKLCKWIDFYQIIHICNSILKYAPIIHESDPTFSLYQLRGFEAEALFLRSLSYFYLVRTFHDVPLVLEASESDDANFYLPVSPADTVLNQIKYDLLRARSGVTEDYGSYAANKGRATMAAINSILADISLWSFEYEDCIAYVEAVENDGYYIVPGGQWFEIFYPGNSLESIFELQFDASLGQDNNIYDLTFFDKQFLVSEKALDLLAPQRSKEIIRGDGSIRVLDNKIWKYAGAAADGKTLRPGDDSKSGNWIVYRMSDILLMKAEALSQLERYDEALSIINYIRDKRLMNPLSTSYSVEAFEDLIMQERSRELAFEGKRWFDLLRMGRRNDFQRKGKLIEIIIEKVPSTQKLLLATKLSNPWGWYLPVEANELERNFNLQQNPYYADYETK
ncbi:MAG: RagB/SusD family nutrient uptake outer membrane protein [Bacteroidales bacterium]|nr:RagB/SusD family nutrient uptake outer membrane protein [Bacteroidales bacterium]